MALRRLPEMDRDIGQAFAAPAVLAFRPTQNI